MRNFYLLHIQNTHHHFIIQVRGNRLDNKFISLLKFECSQMPQKHFFIAQARWKFTLSLAPFSSSNAVTSFALLDTNPHSWMIHWCWKFACWKSEFYLKYSLPGGFRFDLVSHICEWKLQAFISQRRRRWDTEGLYRQEM